ncbi:metallophosphoesterase [Neobacillus citreus]|uniref:Metallophosphoesterase n=1 Tax=Neobacillus citreus TaxID=2833578 RepID=A0A942T2X6_9BACI|nr:metallophosphoesterase [Neobacillus citreus]MCH6266538.1 metallophosphoesterase [Neobacillus citreus]
MLYGVIGVLLLWYMFFILPTQWLKIERVHIPLGLNKKVLHLSDLHVERLRISPKKINRIIKREKPDIILFTGDFMERASSKSLLEPYSKILKQSAVPCYAVLGNKDYSVQPVEICINSLAENKIQVLRNEWIDLEDFVLVGIDDYCTNHHNVNLSFHHIPKEKPSIVMCHDPNLIEYMDQPFTLMVSGHLHGKQINIPFLFGAKFQGPLMNQGIYKALHIHKGRYLYISKGLGQSRYNIRFGVRSEVSVLNL